MATYIILVSYTQKGIENVKESPARLDTAKKVFQSMGAELKEFYLVMGQYDMVVVAEGPDDETAAKLSLAIGSTGAVRTETLRAFTEDEYRKIIASLPRSVVLHTLLDSLGTPPLNITICEIIYMVSIVSLSCKNSV